MKKKWHNSAQKVLASVNKTLVVASDGIFSESYQGLERKQSGSDVNVSMGSKHLF